MHRDCSHIKLQKESCVQLRSRFRNWSQAGRWYACGWPEFATRTWRFCMAIT